jgi:hypothetical protein
MATTPARRLIAVAFVILSCPELALVAQTSPAPEQVRKKAPPPTQIAAQQHEMLNAPAVWTGRSLTINDIAAAAAPILWFSPKEPQLTGEFVAALPAKITAPESLGALGFVGPSDTRRTVYYRIRRVVVREQASCNGDLTDAIRELGSGLGSATWTHGCVDGELPLEALERIHVRYMFFYPSEEGAGAHPFDLEALEIEFAITDKLTYAPLLAPLVEPHSTEADAFATRDSFLTRNAKLPWLSVAPHLVRERLNKPLSIRGVYQANILSASGSAHGVGWYTNVLNIEGVDDFLLPLTVLVEEGKHASSPDRDGDGVYQPHYDVNIQSNDAWGVRDTLRTSKLGGSTYRAEMTKRRDPLHRAFPASVTAAPMVLQYFRKRLEKNGIAKIFEQAMTVNSATSPDDRDLQSHLSPAGSPWLYELVESTTADLCKPEVYRRLDKDLRKYTNGKGFCELSEIHSSNSNLVNALIDGLNKISPGPEKRYGFMNASHRFSYAYRFDGTSGVSVVLPIGREVPTVGGWLVTKGNMTFTTQPERPSVPRYSVELLYTPSASRVIDWYVASGLEGEQLSNEPREWAGTTELGVKFRFNAERLRFVRFVGGRVGVRTVGLRHLRNTRLVFEFGAGSW